MSKILDMEMLITRTFDRKESLSETASLSNAICVTWFSMSTCISYHFLVWSVLSSLREVLHVVLLRLSLSIPNHAKMMESEGQAVVFRKYFLSKVHIMSISVSRILDIGKCSSSVLDILWWLLSAQSYCGAKLLTRKKEERWIKTKLRFCYSLVLYLRDTFFTHWGPSYICQCSKMPGKHL